MERVTTPNSWAPRAQGEEASGRWMGVGGRFSGSWTKKGWQEFVESHRGESWRTLCFLFVP